MLPLNESYGFMSSVKMNLTAMENMSSSLRSTANTIPESLSASGGSGSGAVDGIVETFAGWSTSFLRARRDATSMLANNTNGSAEEFAKAESAIKSAASGAY